METSLLDDLFHFLKGGAGYAEAVAQRLIGSQEVDGLRVREAELSMNFITCHEGFTLADWVSFTAQQNEAQWRGQPRRF